MKKIDTFKLIEFFIITGVCFSIISTICDYKKEQYTTDIHENMYSAIGYYIISVDANIDEHLESNYTKIINIQELSNITGIDAATLERELRRDYTIDEHKLYSILGTNLVNKSHDLQNKRIFWVVSEYIALICAFVFNIIALLLVLKREEKTGKAKGS